MKLIFAILMILVLVLITISPVMAAPSEQTGLVIDPPEVVAPESNDLESLAITGLLFIVLAMITIFGSTFVYAIRKIADSSPPWLLELMKPMLNQGVTQLEHVTEMTPTNIDDELLIEVRLLLEKVGALVGEKSIKVEIGEGVGSTIGEVVPGE